MSSTNGYQGYLPTFSLVHELRHTVPGCSTFLTNTALARRLLNGNLSRLKPQGASSQDGTTKPTVRCCSGGSMYLVGSQKNSPGDTRGNQRHHVGMLRLRCQVALAAWEHKNENRRTTGRRERVHIIRRNMCQQLGRHVATHDHNNHHGLKSLLAETLNNDGAGCVQHVLQV